MDITSVDPSIMGDGPTSSPSPNANLRRFYRQERTWPRCHQNVCRTGNSKYELL